MFAKIFETIVLSIHPPCMRSIYSYSLLIIQNQSKYFCPSTGCKDEEIEKAMLDLFEEYDGDDSGALEKAEFEKMIDELLENHPKKVRKSTHSPYAAHSPVILLLIYHAVMHYALLFIMIHFML